MTVILKAVLLVDLHHLNKEDRHNTLVHFLYVLFIGNFPKKIITFSGSH